MRSVAALAAALIVAAPAGAAELADRSLCTADDSREARCYEATEPAIYQRSRAVARLRLADGRACTAWLVGNEGHLLTAGHCIPDAAAAAAVVVELGAEGPDCATDCRVTWACAGEPGSTGVLLVQTNPDLDYSLVLLPENPVATYGYLQLRPSGAVLGERVYVPQHPRGWGRQIAAESSYPLDPGGVAQVVSLTEPPCNPAAGALFVGYHADTQPGASGSPVVAYTDHRVVALNLCHGESFCASGDPGLDSPNRGAPVGAILADLGPDLPLSAVYPPLFSDGFESGDLSAWGIVVP